VRYFPIHVVRRTQTIAVSILSFLFLLGISVYEADAGLRKRVLISVHAPDAVTRDIVAGALARELDRYRDILVIDERFEQTFLPYMKYKSHVIVQVDVLQMYASESVDHSWKKWKKVPALAAATVMYPVMAISLIALPSVRSDEYATVHTDGYFLANVALFDMTTERSFARTQTGLSFQLGVPQVGKKVDYSDLILTNVSDNKFRSLAKWIVRETHRRPGQTWVFGQSSERAFVNAGSLDGIKPGKKLKIYRPCDIHAPGTANVVVRAAEYAGTVRIVHVDELFSIAEPIGFSLSGEYITKE